jgi:hypothetical protein
MRQSTKGDEREVDASVERLPSGAAGEAGERKLAASYLRAARLTDDPSEREALRRRAAELLAPHRHSR